MQKVQFFLKLAAALGPAFFVALAPGLASLMLTIVSCGILGVVAAPGTKNAFVASTGVLGLSFAILLTAFLLLPEHFRIISFYPIAAASAFSFWCGNVLNQNSGISRNMLSIFILGVLALFSVVAFSALGNEDFGLYGRILFFGLAGFIFSKEKISLGRQTFFLAPITILGVLQFISEPSSEAWFLHVVMPLYAITSLVLGNLVAKKGLWSKLAAASSFVAGIVMIHAVFPALLESSTWEHGKVGTSLPPFELSGLHQECLENKDIAEKVTWIEFYTSRCKPCIEEMASVQKVTEQFNGNDQVRFLSVSSAYFESHEAFVGAQNFHKFNLWHGYEYDTILGHRYAPQGVPVGLLIDKHGIIRFEKRGFGKGDAPYFEADLQLRINTLLAEN